MVAPNGALLIFIMISDGARWRGGGGQESVFMKHARQRLWAHKTRRKALSRGCLAFFYTTLCGP